MKFKKHYFALIAAVILSFSSCETTELDLTVNPQSVTPEQVDAEFLFNNIQLGFNNFVQTVAGNSSFTSEVTRMYAMTGSSIYANAYGPASFNGIWNSAYSGVLADIKLIEPIAEENGFTYHLGVSKIFKAYVLFTLVDMFGDVPYSEALQGETIANPAVDDQISVYQAAFAELDAAIEILETPTTVLPGNDFYYQKNDSDNAVTEDLQENWITAAKTLKLRTLNNVRRNGSALGIDVASEIEDLLDEDDLIDSPEEDWQFQYGDNRLTPNTRHPGYNTFYEVGPGGQYMSNHYMWILEEEKGIEDPRLRYYFYRQDGNANNEDIFTLGCAVQSAPGHYSSVTSPYTGDPVPFCTADAAKGYWGRDHGADFGIPPDDEKRTVYGVYPVGGALDVDDPDDTQNEGEDGFRGAGITPIILSSYTNFIKAEAALTLGTSGDAGDYLETAIRQSIDKVTNFLGADGDVDQQDIDGYVNEVFENDDFGFDDDDVEDEQRLEIIIKEYHIAAFGNGLEMYNAYRRTGYPSNFQPSLEPNAGDFYRSAIYPANYINTNSNAVQKDRTEQIFWDTLPAGALY